MSSGHVFALAMVYVSDLDGTTLKCLYFGLYFRETFRFIYSLAFAFDLMIWNFSM